jgi:hypothetical protein
MKIDTRLRGFGQGGALASVEARLEDVIAALIAQHLSDRASANSGGSATPPITVIIPRR